MEVRPGANPADVKNYDTDRLRLFNSEFICS